MNVQSYPDFNVEPIEKSLPEASVSGAINISGLPNRHAHVIQPVETPYGVYRGGDIRTGGGEPIGGTHRWLAWQPRQSSPKPA